MTKPLSDEPVSPAGLSRPSSPFIILGMIALGGDARYLGIFWLIIVGLIWAGYALSSRRQRQQTSRLRALAARWLSAGPTVSTDRGGGLDVPVRNRGTEL